MFNIESIVGRPHVLIPEKERLSRIQLKMMHESGTFGLLECRKLKYNNKNYLVYVTQGKENVIDYFGTNRKHHGEIKPFSRMLYAIDVIREVDQNGYLTLPNLLLDERYIFLNPQKEVVEFVYIPIETPHVSEKDIDKLCKELLCRLMINMGISSTYEGKNCISFLQQSTVSIDASLSFLKNALLDKGQKEKGKVPLVKAVLLPQSDYGINKMSISKEGITVGRVIEDEKGFLIPNATISSKHCELRINKDRVIINDLNSFNGTYLNGKKLKPHKEYELKNGDTVGMAGYIFRCSIEVLYE